MSATARKYAHPSLPAPVEYVGFTTQSKSKVLAGVQDAYWSDEEAEDAECPLCLDELDISDMNFKPCVCGYQVCRFCWHHIKENLNGRCPACRREYSDEAVEFKPIGTEDHKRLMQLKKRHEREKKELEANGRRHLANVRVVQRNIVYVVGIGPRYAKEEFISTLRSSEYFGQYGKISKILLVKRTPSGGGEPIVGLYITYHRREDASRCIAAVDGSSALGNTREVMRASHGTTKYCMAFLRGAACTDHACMNLHEWGDEKDCFTKEDLTTLKHTMKDTENRSRTSLTEKKTEDLNEHLPRVSGWTKQPGSTSVQANGNHAASSSTSLRQQRRNPSATRGTRLVSGVVLSSGERGNTRKPSVASGLPKAASVESSSRPTTPAGVAALPPRPVPAADLKPVRAKEKQSFAPPLSHSPTSSVNVESDAGSVSFEAAPKSPTLPGQLAGQIVQPPPVGPSHGLPPPPPGLPVPRTRGGELVNQNAYQMSTAAQALLDDVKARREAIIPTTLASPFPDLDRTLQTLTGGDGGFSFNLDPRLARKDLEQDSSFEFESSLMPFKGNYTEAFPGLRPTSRTPQAAFIIPPTLPYPGVPNRPIYDPNRSITPIDRSSSESPHYTGSFNPFAEGSDSPSSTSLFSPLEGERTVSRFGFARGRPSTLSTLESPRILNSAVLVDMPAHSTGSHELDRVSSQLPWNAQQSQQHQSTASLNHGINVDPRQIRLRQDLIGTNNYASRESLLNEVRLRESAHPQQAYERELPIDTAFLSDKLLPLKLMAPSSFQDPAIMSARVGSQHNRSDTTSKASMLSTQASAANLGYPPGLAPLSARDSPPAEASRMYVSVSPSPVPSTALSEADFPALTSEVPASGSPAQQEIAAEPNPDFASDRKAARKAAKKAAAAERAATRQKIAQEKAVVRAAEKLKVTEEKLIAKERAEAEQAEKKRIKQVEVDQERLKQVEDKAIRDAAIELERNKIAALESEVADIAMQLENEKAQLNRLKVAAVASFKAVLPKTLVPVAKPAVTVSEPVTLVQAPLLSKKPKKTKANTRTIPQLKEDELTEANENHEAPSTSVSEAPETQESIVSAISNPMDIRQPLTESLTNNFQTSIEQLLEDIDIQHPGMNLSRHCFFDSSKIVSSSRVPLEYGPLVHALSALSIGGGSFANNMPTGSIDNAVSSFQQLLETLTQTISDLLRLLPRTTWDDSSSFDGVLRDMLKGDDFLDDGGDDMSASGKDDEVAALTLALERRARWMEVQLAKLEELHRDINTAAVRAVLSFNDNGWDRRSFLPKVGNTLSRFEKIGTKEEDGVMIPMSIDEMQKKLVVCQEAAAFAEAEMRESIMRMSRLKPSDEDEESFGADLY